ncbi:ATP-binding cassette domain-containing protein [Candidatus Bathyarchaeota archaeon]|nr:ATP-binding cassette domain-containing protein [Candidatus Bathyarchaeota archaeon]
MVKVELKNVTKRFDNIVAADDVNLTINDGEFFTFLGPSGCGKTTTMRLVAGLEYPTEGSIFYDEEDVTQLQSYKRNTGMVFQNYALWPHMKVEENIAYGLKVRKIPKDEVNKRVEKVIDLVGLEGMGERFPNQLSGGQQQRVALARVLVVEPDILLLDEPLSNLDAKLRVEMREEIKDIQRKLGITTIYVTHDQEEAMAISDRIAIQNHGRIMQVGTPHEIYNNPENLFIATFIGKGALLEGEITSIADLVSVDIGEAILEGVNTGNKDLSVGDSVACVLRPEIFYLKEPDAPNNALIGVIEWSAFIGAVSEVKLRIGNESLTIDAPPEKKYKSGDKLKVYMLKEKTVVLPWMDLD